MDRRSENPFEANPYGRGWDYTGETPNEAPEPSQSGTGQGRGLYSKWKDDGVIEHPLPEGMAQVSMRGGHAIAQPSRGDDVELYVDMGKGKGEWRPGYKALTGLTSGEMGGPYDGEDVVVVCKSADYGPTNETHNGAEWPAEFTRLAKGQKPSTRAELPQEQDGTVSPAEASLVDKTQPAKFTVANFFRPDQRRGYHGKWVDEGRGGAFPGANPQGEMTERRWAGVPAYAQKVGVDGAVMADNIRKRVANLDRKAAEEWRKWYFEASDLAEKIAAETGGTMTDAAIALAALSPKAPWGTSKMTPKQWGVANQTIATKIMHLAHDRADEIFEITDEMALAMNAPNLSAKARIDLYSYDGRDPNFAPKTNLVGKHKIRDIPADVLVVAMRPELRAMTDSGMNALMGARYSDPDYLGGPKTRSFYNNIRAPEISEDATIDVHMVRILSDRIDLFDDEIANMTKNPGVYKIMADAVVTVAHEMGWKPHELQAALWEEQHILHPTKEVKQAIAAREVAINAERAKQGLPPIIFEKKNQKKQKPVEVVQ